MRWRSRFALGALALLPIAGIAGTAASGATGATVSRALDPVARSNAGQRSGEIAVIADESLARGAVHLARPLASLPTGPGTASPAWVLRAPFVLVARSSRTRVVPRGRAPPLRLT
jgi:hypothetical protein